jgi:hypothetical protein
LADVLFLFSAVGEDIAPAQKDGEKPLRPAENGGPERISG